MFYDLHLHSCLSPCADKEMTSYNIFNMAALKGLELISITDHNSMRQYRHLREAAEHFGIALWYGVEVQTIEDIHVCCYFRSETAIQGMQDQLDQWHPNIKNNIAFFGRQVLLEGEDVPCGEEDRLLLVSLNVTINGLCDFVHRLGGAVVLAHAINRSNGIITQLGFIPRDLAFDGIEVRTEEEKQLVLRSHGWIDDTVWLTNSDAHRLVEIHEAVYQMSEDDIGKLWRNAR